MYNLLEKHEIKDLPQIGQGHSDFESFDDVLLQVAGHDTQASLFARASCKYLRELGCGQLARRYEVAETYEKARMEVDVVEWTLGLQFSHLMLPCATAELSQEESKGITRVILPFLKAPGSPTVEDAVTCLCSLTWFLVFLFEVELVKTGRVRRAPHKARMKEEDETIWCNKWCRSNRIATKIQDRGKSMVYMYEGGGAVDHNQTSLFGNVVVNCKTWRWAAWAYASARLAGLASNNSLDAFCPDLSISEDDGSGDTSTAGPQSTQEFRKVCTDV